MMPIRKLGYLASQVEVELRGDRECEIRGVAPLATAQNGDLSYCLGGRYRRHLAATQASALVLAPADVERAPAAAHLLVSPQPELVFSKLLHYFERPRNDQPGVHPSAVIGRDCEIDSTAKIAARCVIGEGVCIGPRSVISAGTVIADGASIGSDVYCYPNVTIYHDCLIGDHVILHSGVVIGADGFGLTREGEGWAKIPQVGRVVLGNDVEVGANATIDRGCLEDTVLEEGVKVDNQVQIGHNVRIGAHTVIAGCAGIAGSTVIGRHCMIGGGVCIAEHIEIADRVALTGMSGVSRSIKQPGVYSSGMSVQPSREWWKAVAHFKQLDTVINRLRNLESQSHDNR